MKATFIWFDLGYTLLYKPREELYARVLREQGFNATIRELEEGYHVVDKHFMREYPGVFGHNPDTFMPWFLGVLNYRLGIRLDVGRAWERLKEISGGAPEIWLPFDNVRESLEGLQRRNMRLGVISNWDPSAREILAHHGLTPYFEQIVVSSEAGCEKPDPRIFRLGLEGVGVSPEESLYVGDNYYVDGVGARAVGMDYLIINRFGSLGVEELEGQPIIRDVSQIGAWLDSKSK